MANKTGPGIARATAESVSDELSVCDVLIHGTDPAAGICTLVSLVTQTPRIGGVVLQGPPAFLDLVGAAAPPLGIRVGRLERQAGVHYGAARLPVHMIDHLFPGRHPDRYCLFLSAGMIALSDWWGGMMRNQLPLLRQARMLPENDWDAYPMLADVPGPMHMHPGFLAAPFGAIWLASNGLLPAPRSTTELFRRFLEAEVRRVKVPDDYLLHFDPVLRAIGTGLLGRYRASAQRAFLVDAAPLFGRDLWAMTPQLALMMPTERIRASLASVLPSAVLGHLRRRLDQVDRVAMQAGDRLVDLRRGVARSA